MLTNDQAARENPTAASNSGRRIPAVRDATRKVLNALETLRLAAQADGDMQALMNAEVMADMLGGRRH